AKHIVVVGVQQQYVIHFAKPIIINNNKPKAKEDKRAILTKEINCLPLLYNFLKLKNRCDNTYFLDLSHVLPDLYRKQMAHNKDLTILGPKPILTFQERTLCSIDYHKKLHKLHHI
ncbi:hypothetical protein ACJX0J_031152, partial [Zea mays]